MPSIEQNLERLANAAEALVTILQTGTVGTAELGGAVASGTGYKVLEGDAPGTRYWVIEKNNTVYKQGPDAPNPDPAVIGGAKIVSAEEFLQKQAEFAKNAKAGKGKQQTAAQTTKPAETPAQGQSDTASNASSNTSAPSHKDVVAKLMELSKKDKEAMFGVLAKFLPGKEKADLKVSALEPLNKAAEIIAAVDALLNPTPAAEADPFA